MATCMKCGASIGYFSGSVEYCLDCTVAKYKTAARERTKAQRSSVVETGPRRRDVDAILLTTETAPRLKIYKRIKIVTAEVACDISILKDVFADAHDIVGGREENIQMVMREAHRTALYELKEEAFSVGANGVVGVELKYVKLSGSSNMVILAAFGTAVMIDDERYS